MLKGNMFDGDNPTLLLIAQTVLDKVKSAKLKERRDKYKDDGTWQTYRILQKLDEEVAELKEALNLGLITLTIEEIADVSNVCDILTMQILDVNTTAPRQVG